MIYKINDYMDPVVLELCIDTGQNSTDEYLQHYYINTDLCNPIRAIKTSLAIRYVLDYIRNLEMSHLLTGKL